MFLHIYKNHYTNNIQFIILTCVTFISRAFLCLAIAAAALFGQIADLICHPAGGFQLLAKPLSVVVLVVKSELTLRCEQIERVAVG